MLVKYGAIKSVMAELKDDLRYLKQYTKSDYKVNDWCLYGACTCIFIA